MGLRTVYQIFKDAALAWVADRAPTFGAALAYYTVFSLAPTVLLAVGIASLFWDADAVRNGIIQQVRDTVGGPAADAFGTVLSSFSQSGTGRSLTIVSLVTLLFGASGVFGQLQDSLNAIWKTEAKTRPGFFGWLHDRLLSFAAVLGTGFLLLVSLVVSSVLSALGKFVTGAGLPGGVVLWEAINFIVSLLFIGLLFALIFKLLPDAPVAWGDVWGAGLVTALLFAVGKELLGLYLGRSGLTTGFGAAGSLVVILFWVYYSSQILLFGAELSRAYAHHWGSMHHQPEPVSAT